MDMILKLLPLSLLIAAFFIVMVGIHFVKESALYQKYKEYKRVRELLRENNQVYVTEMREALIMKFSNIPVVNLSTEDLDQAQDLLGMNVVPIEFSTYVIDDELMYSKHLDTNIRDSILCYSEWNQMPIRTTYKTVLNGIDDSQNLNTLLRLRYTKGNFFLPDELLSPQYLNTLLHKNIVLLGICKIARGQSREIQVLLIPYELEIKKKPKPPFYVVSPQGLVRIWLCICIYPGFTWVFLYIKIQSSTLIKKVLFSLAFFKISTILVYVLYYNYLSNKRL